MAAPYNIALRGRKDAKIAILMTEEGEWETNDVAELWWSAFSFSPLRKEMWTIEAAADEMLVLLSWNIGNKTSGRCKKIKCLRESELQQPRPTFERNQTKQTGVPARASKPERSAVKLFIYARAPLLAPTAVAINKNLDTFNP